MKKTEKNDSTALETETAHHPYGPSRWPALVECPCWEGKPATENTKLGTTLHALFAEVMCGKYHDDSADSLERNVVNAAKELLRTVVPTLGRFYVEQLVELPGPDGIDDNSGIHGWLDLAWIDASTLDLHILDLKLSENPERNYRPQLLAYAAGMARFLRLEGPRNVVLHMLYADSGKLTTTILDIGDAMTEYQSHYRRIAKIVQGKACQPKQCGWCELCARFQDCPAMKAVVDKAGPRLADATKPERWATFTPEHKAQLCALADTLQKWCVAVKEQAAADARAGEIIEDPEHGIVYSIHERKGRIELQVQGAWDAVKDCLTPDAFKTCLSVSTRKLKEALVAAGMKPKDAEALIEWAGVRGPVTTVFVRRGVKEVA